MKCVVAMIMFLLMITSNFANALEIHCKLFDEHEYAGELLFNYNEKTQILVLVAHAGEGNPFIDFPGSWIDGVKGKSMKNLSKNPDLIWGKDNGAWEWEFKIDRKSGGILAQQKIAVAAWSGKCKKVDRSNKF
jgi:hypothetical protein